MAYWFGDLYKARHTTNNRITKESENNLQDYVILTTSARLVTLYQLSFPKIGHLLDMGVYQNIYP